MKDAEKIYTELWSKALPLFELGQYETDPLINDPADRRRGLTLRARLKTEVASKIEEYTKEIREFLPHQYFTPISDLHITILTVVSCNNDFHHNPEMDDFYCEEISDCLKGISPPRITFSGITSSPSCLLLRGYPQTGSLKELRNQLRERFNASTLPNSVDFRYPLETAHATIMRFTEPHDDIFKFTRFIKDNQMHSFGTQVIDEVEFVTNDWYHKKNNTKVIKIFSLNH